ncbi:ribonuclease III family protein [Candidatus Gromoviella agglomerans]|uniref:ribonuclease III family protein n=1 Tax=Candidatus Gromoviella agglomerans TaxID=2806609 RepID=UPI001E507653|nr:ribonuclease III domain-containing protein [Candidatus Gromoviella agglomerans]
MNLQVLEKKIGHVFRNKQLLVDATTHSSVYQSNRLMFERMEFLGDKLLNLEIALVLFKKYPAFSESALTSRLASIVRREGLFVVAQDLSLAKFAQFRSKNVDKKILADIVEAIIGCIYLDGGNHIDFIHTFFSKFIENEVINYRSELQELLHKLGFDHPVYENYSSKDGFGASVRFNIDELKQSLMKLNSLTKKQLTHTICDVDFPKCNESVARDLDEFLSFFCDRSEKNIGILNNVRSVRFCPISNEIEISASGASIKIANTKVAEISLQILRKILKILLK